MKPKHKRLVLISGLLLGLGVVTLFSLVGLRDNLVFFYTPSELQHTYIHREKRIRVGGLVQPHSVVQEGETVRFTVRDQTHRLQVVYAGLLPDLFREGQGIVAEGYLQDPALFRADIVLAKHDETYRPKDLADRLDAQ